MAIIRNYFVVYKALRPYAPDVTRLFIKISCGIALIGLINIASPYLFKQAIDGFQHQSPTVIYGLVLGYGVVWALSQTLFFLKNIFAAMLASTLERGVSLAMLAKLWQPHLYEKDYRAGAHYEKFQRATRSFSDITTHLTWTLLPAVMELLAASVMLWKVVSGWVAMVLVIVVMMCFFASLASAKLAEDIVKNIHSESNHLTSMLLERMSFSETIFLMDAMPFEMRQASARYDRWLKIVIDGNKKMGYLLSQKIMIIGVGLCVSLLITTYEIQAGRLTVGDFAMVNAYMLQFSMPMIYLAGSIFDIKKNIAALEEATDFLSDLCVKPRPSGLGCKRGRQSRPCF